MTFVEENRRQDWSLEPGPAKEEHCTFGADLQDFLEALQAATSEGMRTAVYAIVAALLGSGLALVRGVASLLGCHGNCLQAYIE